MTLSFDDRRAFGSILLERFDSRPVPKSVKPVLDAFREEHRAFKAACAEVDDAEQACEKAQAKLFDADATLDAAVLSLADALVGAGLGSRMRPFAGYSPYSPSRLVSLAYARELREVRAMVGRVRAADVDAKVRAAVDACAKSAERVAAALGELTAPQADYVRARGERAARLTRWLRAFDRLRKHAAAAWVDHPGTFAAVFAPPTKVQRPTRKRRSAAAVSAPSS